MKFLKKLRSSNFWVSMISAVVLILQAVFDVTIKAEYLNQIIMAILGLLVMSGIISDSSNGEVTVNQSVDMESVKSTVVEMLAKTTTSIENVILNIANQFQAIKDGGVQNSNEIVNAQPATSCLENATTNVNLTTNNNLNNASVNTAENQAALSTSVNQNQAVENANQNQVVDSNISNTQNVQNQTSDTQNNIENMVQKVATSVQPNFDTL